MTAGSNQRRCYLGLIAMWVALPNAVAEMAPLRLTLDEVVSRANASSPRRGELAALVDAATAGVEATRAQRRVTADLSVAYRRQSSVPELTLTLPQGDRTLFPNIPDNFRSRLESRLPVYTGGRVERMLDAAQHDVSAAASDERSGRREVTYSARLAFYRLVMARAAEHTLEEGVRSFAAHLVVARDRAAVGMAAANEVLAVEVEHDRAELRRLDATNDVAAANAGLVSLLDLEQGTVVLPVELAEVADAAPGEEVAVLIAEAVATWPERTALVERVAAASSRVDLARTGRLPQVLLSGGVDLADPNSRILPPTAELKASWDLGVGVQMSLFDGGRTAAQVGQMRALQTAAEERLVALDRRIAVDVETALLEMRTAVAATVVARRAKQSADENLRVARDRYQAGVLTSADLVDAENALLSAGLDQTFATIRAHLAQFAFERAMGR